MEEEREIRCNGRDCEQVKTINYPARYDEWMRADAYGIPTGLYCDKCYENNYPYKRDFYEHDEPLYEEY